MVPNGAPELTVNFSISPSPVYPLSSVKWVQGQLTPFVCSIPCTTQTLPKGALTGHRRSQLCASLRHQSPGSSCHSQVRLHESKRKQN